MFSEKLNQYLIPGGLHYINKWCEGFAVHLKIKGERSTKLGDYSFRNGKNIITLNYDLPQELSFLTLTHEIAHMLAFKQYNRAKIAPHGNEWKNQFTQLILESLHLYPADFQEILLDFAKNPRASYYAYLPIVRYFNLAEEKTALQDLPQGTKFRMKNRIFVKAEKRKIRYICIEVASGKKFAVHPLAPIDEIF